MNSDVLDGKNVKKLMDCVRKSIEKTSSRKIDVSGIPIVYQTKVYDDWFTGSSRRTIKHIGSYDE